MSTLFHEIFGSFEPAAIIFDCDGLLVNTEQVWLNSQARFLSNHQAQLPPDRARALVGRPPEEVVAALAEATGLSPQETFDQLLAIHKEDVVTQTKLLPGAKELIEKLSGRIPLAVASNSPGNFLANKLKLTGIDALVDATVSLDEVAQGKPHPEIYLKGAELLDVAPEQVLAFEDSETGATAARRANMRLIGVPSVPGQEPEADVIISALNDPDFLAWVDSWKTCQSATAETGTGATTSTAVAESQISEQTGAVKSAGIKQLEAQGIKELKSAFAQFGETGPEAVVFDCDGLLLDTESIWHETQQRVLRHFEAQLNEHQAAEIIGSSLEVAAGIIAEAAQEEYDVVLRKLRKEFVTNLSVELPLMPGAKEVLELVSARVPVAVASNSWIDSLRDKLTRTGLIQYVDHLEAADTVGAPKPAPDMYAAAALALGAEPERCLALEDSVTGARAATGAGLALLAVTENPRPEMQAKFAVPNLEWPGLKEWIKTWDSVKLS